MIIDLSCYPTKEIDSAWRHDGDPFTGERLIKMMDGPYYVNGKARRVDKAFIQPPASSAGPAVSARAGTTPPCALRRRRSRTRDS